MKEHERVFGVYAELMNRLTSATDEYLHETAGQINLSDTLAIATEIDNINKSITAIKEVIKNI